MRWRPRRRWRPGRGAEPGRLRTGYSYLVRLKRLPFTEVKVDSSFVGRILESPDDEVVVESILDLAAALGIRSVGKDESAEVASTLLAMGCVAAQGWHFARPMNAVSATAWLTEHVAAGHSAAGNGAAGNGAAGNGTAGRRAAPAGGQRQPRTAAPRTSPATVPVVTPAGVPAAAPVTSARSGASGRGPGAGPAARSVAQPPSGSVVAALACASRGRAARAAAARGRGRNPVGPPRGGPIGWPSCPSPGTRWRTWPGSPGWP